LSLLVIPDLRAQSQVTRRYFQWDPIADVRLPEGNVSPRADGAFAGISNGVLILAGGGPVADSLSGAGARKRNIYILEKDAPGYQWMTAGVLDRPVGDGISLQLEDGILCIGGVNEDGISADILSLTWDTQGRQVIEKKLGSLPADFEATAGMVAGEYLYLCGIANHQNRLIRAGVRSLADFPRSALRWEVLPPCPGPPRKFLSWAAQSDGSGMCLYLFAGRIDAKGESESQSTSYVFSTTTREWSLRGMRSPLRPMLSARTPAIPYGTSSIFILGGTDVPSSGGQAPENQSRPVSVTIPPNDAAASLPTRAMMDAGPVPNNIYIYNTITDTFFNAGEIPGAHAIADALLWDDSIILLNDGAGPGVSPLLRGHLLRESHSFGLLNYSLLGGYLFLLLLIGIYFSFRQKSTTDYFKGGGRVPWWAAGLSVFGTALSAITFMAIPAKTFATDWSYFLYSASVLLVTPVVVAFFIPFYRRLNVTSAYEYLEKRFNVTARLFGSASFILFQIGRIGIVVYLPAIALSLVTGIDIYVSILSMGLLSLIYTLMGGIEAVVWTDAIQVLVLMGGALLSVFFIVFSLDGNIGTLLESASSQMKFNVLNFDPSLVEPTFWVVVIGGFFANLITYSSDQAMVQRYLTTKDEKGAGRSAWTNAVLVVPASILFFGVGTALFLFYSQNPQAYDPFAQNNDAIFPWYIVNSLPNGISGLLIAGLFSAAMSTLSSSMNSVATAYTTDFYVRFKVNTTEKSNLQVARIATLFSGVLGLLFAFWMTRADIISLWDQFCKILGLFAGGLGGLFVLGIFSRRANGTGAIAGLIASSVIQYWVATYTDLHIFLYGGIGLCSCVVIGHLASLIIPDRRNPQGAELTIYNKFFSAKGR
jgi:SSS family transporter